VYEYSKVVDYCAAGPKKYSISYVTPKNEIKTKIKINGINQKNCIFENDVTGEKETKITHKNFKDMYFKTVNYNNTIEEDIKFLFKKDNKFILPDRLKKINYNRTTKEINDKKSWFSIHCTQIGRTLFKTQWDGRNAINYPYTIPNGYKI